MFDENRADRNQTDRRLTNKLAQEADIVDRQARGATRVIAVASGKGGVGKTNTAANIAVAMSDSNRNVMLLDADLSLANVDVLLGLQPRFNLAHVVSGDVDLASTLVEGPRGLHVVPASSGNFAMTDLDAASQAAIINAFSELTDQPDVLVIDTPAGINSNVARFVQAAGQAVVVVCDEPSSITDAYALVKVFSRDYGVSRFQVVTNQTRSEFDGRQLFQKLQRVSDRFLDVALSHVGNVPHDYYLKRSVGEQRAVVDAYPKSISAQAFQRIAKSLISSPASSKASGNLQFFFESLLTTRPLRQRSVL